MQEFFLTVQRQISTNEFKKIENDPSREYHALLEIYASSVLEEIMVMQRRMMLGGMRDPTATILTIILTAIEESVVRCTVVYRDEFWNWVTGRPKSTEAEIRARRLVQTACVATSMRIEVTSIMTCR